MFKWNVSVQGDKVSIYEEHKKIGHTSVFTQTYYCIKLSLLGGWIRLRTSLSLAWLTSGSWEEWNDLGEKCLLLHGSPKLDYAETTRKRGKKWGFRGKINLSCTSSGQHTSQILGSGSVIWNYSFSRQEKIAEKRVLFLNHLLSFPATSP